MHAAPLEPQGDKHVAGIEYSDGCAPCVFSDMEVPVSGCFVIDGKGDFHARPQVALACVLLTWPRGSEGSAVHQQVHVNVSDVVSGLILSYAGNGDLHTTNYQNKLMLFWELLLLAGSI